MEFKDLNEMNNYLNKDKDEDEILEEPTIGELADAYKHMGLQDHVYAFNDDANLIDDISDELKKKKISEVNADDEDEVNDLLEIAGGIVKYNERELTEDDLEAIREDKMYRGEDPDEF